MKKMSPFYGLDEHQTSKLKAIGLKKASDYYKLTYQQQVLLFPDIPLGGVPLDPSDPNYRCTELVPPANPEPGIVTPVVDWTWRTPFPGQEHVIDTRPWWGEPDREVDATSSTFNEQQYWYPDPAQGWKVFGYQFGGTGGQLGYLLMYNNYTGIMRLFVYLPGVELHNFNNLLCQVSITGPDRTQSDLWAFPLQDSPPAARKFEDSAGNSFSEVPRSILLSWPGQDKPYHTLSAAVGGAFGVWLRAEIPTLYDPVLYPSTQPLRPLGGCLSIFLPGTSSGTAITHDDRRMLHLRFSTVDIAQTNLIANLRMDLSGKAIPVARETDVLGVLKNTVLGGKAGVSGAMGAIEFLGLEAASGGGATIIAAAGLAGAFFGLTDNGTPPPEYKVKMIGTARGLASGKTVTVHEATTFDLNLSETFKPVYNEDGTSNPVGYPQSYQRCEKIRFGVYGFRPHGTDKAFLSADPRPDAIFQDWYNMQSPDVNVPFLVVGPIGYLQTAPWAEIDIVSQTAQLEVINFRGSLPYERTIIMELPFQEDNWAEIISPNDVYILGRSAREPREKLLIRWIASIQPRDPAVNSFTVQYALDVSHLLEMVPEPGTGTDEWPD